MDDDRERNVPLRRGRPVSDLKRCPKNIQRAFTIYNGAEKSIPKEPSDASERTSHYMGRQARRDPAPGRDTGRIHSSDGDPGRLTRYTAEERPNPNHRALPAMCPVYGRGPLATAFATPPTT